MKYLIIISLLFLTSASYAGTKSKTYGSVVIDEVTSIYDGDTFRATIKHWPEIIGKRIGIRVNRIDTPEMRGKCQKEKELARQAKQFAVTQLRAGKKITLNHIKRGKYFRIVADVSIDGKDLGTMLINNNLAIKYDGGKKAHDWCK